MAEENAQDPQGQSTNTQDPSGQDGKSTDTDAQKTNPENVDNLPEKFKGKTVTDIAKSYLELEKQLGQQSQSVSETRKQLAQWEALGRILEEDPELYKQVEAKIAGLSGKKSDTTVNDQAPKLDEVRVTQENSIITEFEREYGINSLSTEKRESLNKKIATELAEMLDPGGKKQVKEVLDTIPLPKLKNYLVKAYKLATSDDHEERARLEALVENRQNREASFGNIPSSSISTKQGQLTEDEKKVAKRMGISEEKYLKRKQELEKE